MTQSDFSPDDLIQGLQAIISKNRSSFSDDEISLLQGCIESLNDYKAMKDKKNLVEVVTKVLSIVAKPEVVNLINDWIHHWSKL
jgi:hypothetical protein